MLQFLFFSENRGRHNRGIVCRMPGKQTPSTAEGSPDLEGIYGNHERKSEGWVIP
jgi:hypothetical protein